MWDRRADGTIPEEEEALLTRNRQMLKRERRSDLRLAPMESIWRRAQQKSQQVHSPTQNDKCLASADIRFTTRGDVLYATVLAIPEKDEVTIQSLGSSLRLLTKPIDKVELLGAGIVKNGRKPCAD